jgi:hypothetical protein
VVALHVIHYSPLERLTIACENAVAMRRGAQGLSSPLVSEMRKKNCIRQLEYCLLQTEDHDVCAVQSVTETKEKKTMYSSKVEINNQSINQPHDAS